MDVEIFESSTKTLRIQKYPDTCGRALFSSKSLGAILAFFFFSTRLPSKNSMDLREKAHCKQSLFNSSRYFTG